MNQRTALAIAAVVWLCVAVAFGAPTWAIFLFVAQSFFLLVVVNPQLGLLKQDDPQNT